MEKLKKKVLIGGSIVENIDFLWKSILLVFSGVILLRIAGRKSISQMTIAQTVIMISIGSIIIQPIIENSIWKTITVAAIFIASLILMEYLQLKFNNVEKFLTGNAKVVIEDGILLTENLKKLRFTVDQLEMRLRQQGINDINKVKYATLESNGQIGFELKREEQPLTVGEFEKMLQSFMTQQTKDSPQQHSPLFDEIINKQHANPNFHKLQ